MTRRKKWILGIVGALLAALVIFGYPFVKVYLALDKKGMFDKHEKISYSAGVQKNLNELYKAIMLFHDSEGQLPDANKWMDQIANRLQTSDMKEGEGDKKLVDPSTDMAPHHYGFAMNAALSGKFKGDIKDPDKTVLLFQSSDLVRNANGDPAKLAPKPPRGDATYGVTLSGKIVKI